jgi:Protein of unknown function (DUF3800)
MAECRGQAPGLVERPRIRVVIECFFDDSGQESDPTHRFVVMAGYMAGDWNQLYRAWRSLLLKHGLRYVHMKEMIGISQKKGWLDGHLTEVLREFIGAIKDSILVGFGVAVDLQAFQKVPEDIRKRLGDAQIFCCSRILRRIMDRLDESGMGNEPISVTFDQDFDFARRRLPMFIDLRKRDPKLRAALAQVSFASSDHFYPLQAADLLAWETRRHIAHMAGEARPSGRWSDLTVPLPYDELDYAAGEYWTQEWFDQELPKLRAQMVEAMI